jgi:long-chain acyl-CoA synthetase
MKARIEGAVSTASPTRQKLFHWAVGVGLETVPYRNTGQALPGFLGLKARVADKLVLSKLRGRLGLDRTNIVLSGSAPLSEEVHSFFCALQLDVLEGYGLTETCPALTVGRPGAVKVGTVGQPLPHIEIKIADDGEILAKGPNITQGYLNRPDATGEAFNDDGWFHTGDLGTMDSDGFVKITGRKKELMKTSGGKYIAPAKIENRIKNHTLIQEAVTVADTRNYATALIAIDEEELAIWADQRGVAADPKGEAVLAEVQKHVDGVNTTLAKYETIKYFRIIPALTTDNGFLTASLKVKRRVVYSEYADLIDDMYTQGAKKG